MWHSMVWFLPLLEFHLLGGSSVGRAEVLAGSSVGVFQFLLSPEAMSDLNINGVKTYSTAHINYSAPGSTKSVTDSYFLFAAFLPYILSYRKRVSKLIGFGVYLLCAFKITFINPLIRRMQHLWVRCINHFLTRSLNAWYLQNEASNLLFGNE